MKAIGVRCPQLSRKGVGERDSVSPCRSLPLLFHLNARNFDNVEHYCHQQRLKITSLQKCVETVQRFVSDQRAVYGYRGFIKNQLSDAIRAQRGLEGADSTKGMPQEIARSIDGFKNADHIVELTIQRVIVPVATLATSTAIHCIN